MKIALLNEFSQATKNTIILKALEEVVEPLHASVYNVGMSKPLSDFDKPEAYTEENPRLTYLNLGIQASLLLNSKAVDFIVTGCGTGQGALMSLNAHPGVICGYCIEPTDAYLFLQINNGNALSIPYAKGFGWGAELNLKGIFKNAFSSPKGMGYPQERKDSQNRNAELLDQIKTAVTLPLVKGLENIEQSIVRASLTPRFLQCFDEGCQNKELMAFVNTLR